MLKHIDISRFFRIRGYEGKTSWVTCLLPMILAYSLGYVFNPLTMIINSVVICCILMTIFSLNDYVDLGNESNYMGEILKRGSISKGKALILCFIPLFSISFLPFLGVYPSLSILSFLFLGIMYSIPGISLKSRKKGWTVNSVMGAILFFESLMIVSGALTFQVFSIFLIMILFHMYTEQIHQYLESEQRSKTRVIVFPFLTIIISLILSSINIVFLLAAFFSVMRIISFRDIGESRLSYLRGNSKDKIVSGTYSAYEFIIYIPLALAGII